jgi:hypothetical protein
MYARRHASRSRGTIADGIPVCGDKKTLDVSARQARADGDPTVRTMLAESVFRFSKTP